MSQPSFGSVKRSAYHAWVPQSKLIHDRFVGDLIKIVPSLPNDDPEADEAIKKFSDALSSEQKELFNTALDQAKQYYTKWADPHSIVKDFDAFLVLLRQIIRTAPQFYKAEVRDVTIGEPIGVPLYLVLDLVTNTNAGYTLFTQLKFNTAIKDLLDNWGKWLRGPESNKTLTDKGWFSEGGMAVLEAGLGKLTFEQTYKCDVKAGKSGGYGFKSWDTFFIREFKDPSLRPIHTYSGIPFLYNACESTALRTAKDVQVNDTFWLKSQNYSLFDILGGKDHESLAPEYADQLKLGSAYQAFLSPQDYHRWHSPLKGNIVAARRFQGTYYAFLPDDGAPSYDTDLAPGDPHGAMIRSQPWLSVVATRAVYIIKPQETDKDAPFTLAAFVAIGMVEVSSCDITKKEGDVNAGDEIGKFHFGGSSYLVIVKPKPEYEIVFQDYYDTPIRPGQHRWINSVIGQFLRTDRPPTSA